MKKAELLEALENSREDFLELIEGMDEEAMLFKSSPDGWSVKDILAHLTRWEAELVKLLWQLRQGIQPTTLHFSALQVDEINAQWLQEDQNRPLDRILDDFHGVRNQTIRRVESFSEIQLQDKEKYPWLKGEALWEFIAKDSFEHEIEHMTQVREIRTMLHLDSASKVGGDDSNHGQT